MSERSAEARRQMAQAAAAGQEPPVEIRLEVKSNTNTFEVTCRAQFNGEVFAEKRTTYPNDVDRMKPITDCMGYVLEG